MFVDLLGRIYRKIPPLRGKGRFAALAFAPFLRGKGIELVVDMNNPGGGKLICNLDDWIPWNVYLFGRYQIEHKYESFVMRDCADCKVIFDIGANIGYYTVQFCRMLHTGEVHAFEPCSYQFTVLNKNIALNKIANVVANKVIISDTGNMTRKIYFSGMDNTGSSSLEVTTAEFEEVECTTVDSYCGQKNIDTIDVVKVDVEGHELSVLKGMSQMLRRGKITRIFLEINSHALSAAGTSANEIISYLHQFSYSPYSIATGEVTDYSLGHDESLVLFQKDLPK